MHRLGNATVSFVKIQVQCNTFYSTTKKNGQHTAPWSILHLPKKEPDFSIDLRI